MARSRSISSVSSPSSLAGAGVDADAGRVRPSDRRLDPIESWFAARGWSPYPFQREAWAACLDGRDGLVHVPTGAGKTFAAYGGPLAELLDDASVAPDGGVAIVYVSPLRAVSRDIEKALREPLEELANQRGLSRSIGARTGDTSQRERAKQRDRLPHVLVTTPESLTLLLTREDAARRFASLRCVIVDEWHELLAGKRGVQVELALARLRRFAPSMRTWALSATLRDPDAAARRVAGVGAEPVLVRATIDRPVVVESLVPDSIDRFPWSGHFGLAMLDPLVRELDPAVPTLVFTNTRAQAERWFAEISKARPEWLGRVALHHGSIDRDVRERVEAGIKDGSIGIVVCTSSLDLGVDFAPVERVVQIGSPKGIARLLQRAGRSGHRPGETCRVLCVPTHAFELVEIAAARVAIERLEIEERPGGSLPLDCLVQHLVTCALGGGFVADELFDEVRRTVSFESLERAEFDWCLALAEHGGASLAGYDEQHRIARADAEGEPDPAGGRYVVPGRRTAQIHRLNIGTISADSTVSLRFVGGRRIGTIEEHFVSKLRRGDRFLFAGRMLEFVRLRDMTATVRPAPSVTSFTPHWAGSRFPLSTSLSHAVRREIDRVAEIIESDRRSPNDRSVTRATLGTPELDRARPILETQARISRLPRFDEVLCETCTTRDGRHLFLYPFEGRLVHEGIALLLALRMGRLHPATFAISFNDYGIEWLSERPVPFERLVTRELFDTNGLVDDLAASVNAGELGRRQFRDIARVAGLVHQRYPGAEKSARQVQAGATLMYEVFESFDPENLLLRQARREVMERQFEEGRLARTLDRLRTASISPRSIDVPGPFALPLVADRLGSAFSTETLEERIAAMRLDREDDRIAPRRGRRPSR